MTTDFANHVALNPVNRAILSRWHLLDLPGADLGVTIDVANQARVHLWYPAHFGYDYAALVSEEDGTRRFLVRETRAGMADVERQRALSATRMNHLNLSVTDVPTTQAFLEKYFGMRHGGGNANIAFVTDENAMMLTLTSMKVGRESEER